MPPLPGIDDVPFLTNRTILDLDQVPEHLLVVGGSYIGLEFAQMHRRFGAAVTIVERLPHLIAREDTDISAWRDLAKDLRSRWKSSDRLDQAGRWLDEVSKRWDEALARLKRFVEE